MAAKELLECLLFHCGQSAHDSEALLRSPLASPLGQGIEFPSNYTFT